MFRRRFQRKIYTADVTYQIAAKITKKKNTFAGSQQPRLSLFGSPTANTGPVTSDDVTAGHLMNQSALSVSVARPATEIELKKKHHRA